MIVHYLPIATTLFSAWFAAKLIRRRLPRPQAHHLSWWAVGVVAYGLGTLLESLITLIGWQEGLFRAWYIAGALMGGAPLAQGTVYLIFTRRTAHWLSLALVIVIIVGSTAVLSAPLDYSLVNPDLPQGRVIQWRWVRLISPFINTYAFVFLVGGAVVSAIRFRKQRAFRGRFLGNCLIAVGAILPGIGGVSSRVGHTEVLYVAELIGIVLIYLGYRFCLQDPPPISNAFSACDVRVPVDHGRQP